MDKRVVKIRDVAQLAGVSTATVSRALARPDLVSDTTRAAVEAAIAATGYTINHAARNLRQRRTAGVVALVPNLSNPFFAQILSGIADVLAPAGYNLLVADTRGPNGARVLDYADPSRADGLIVLDAAVPRDAFGRGIPAVLACEWIDGIAAPRVQIDNELGASLAIEHLADLGHRLIAHVTGPRGNVLTESRLAGIERTRAARGLPEITLIGGDFSIGSGRAAASVWADMPLTERPTAVFCSSDEMAAGFIGAVQHRGIAVPRDVSVIGFDDIELVAHMTPALTTIRQPRVEIGQQAARRLLGQLDGTAEEGDVVLPVELILRESTGIARI